MAFNLIGKFGLDGSGFFSGLRNIDAQAKNRGTKIGNSIASGIKGQIAAAFGGAAIAAAFRNRVQDAGEIRDQATALGISTEAFQQNRFAAEQANISNERLVRAQQRLARAIGETLEGSKEYEGALRRLGLTQKDIESNDLQAQFIKIAENVKDAEVNTQLMNDIMVALGRSGAEVIPVFKAGFAEMAQSATNLGIVMEDEVVQKLAKVGDEMTTLKRRSQKEFADISVAVLGGFTKALQVTRFTIGSIGALLGNLSVTGSVSKAEEASRQFAEDFFKEQFEFDRQARKSRDARQRAVTTSAGLSDPSGLSDASENFATAARSKSTQLSQANQLARLGLFVTRSSDKALRSQQSTEKSVRTMQRDISRIKETLNRAI